MATNFLYPICDGCPLNLKQVLTDRTIIVSCRQHHHHLTLAQTNLIDIKHPARKLCTLQERGQICKGYLRRRCLQTETRNEQAPEYFALFVDLTSSKFLSIERQVRRPALDLRNILNSGFWWSDTISIQKCQTWNPHRLQCALHVQNNTCILL